MLSLASATSAQADELARSIALYRSARERFDGVGLRNAERSLRRLLRAGHHSSEAYFYLGTSLSAQGRHNEAADGYAATLRLDPASVSAWDNMAISLDEAGRLSEASAGLAASIALNPRASNSHASLGKLQLQMGEAVRGARHFEAALALAPSSAATYYELGRSTELYGGPHGVNEAFGAAQRLALAQWRHAMGCAPSHPADTRDTGGAGGAVVGAVTRRVVLSEGGAEYGREVPRPHADAEAWRRGGRGLWPHLRFVERAVVARELRDVWISGNEAVVTDDACGVYLPHHGVQVPLHHNLPEERPPQRWADARIRRVGYADGGGEAEEGGREGSGKGGGEGEGEGGGGGEGGSEGEIGEEELVISLGQLFFANYYSFLTDALARLVLARDALTPSQAARLRVVLPTDRRQLRPFMWPLLQRLGVQKTNSYPYPVRPRSAGVADAAAARLRARRLLVVDWEAGVAPGTRNDTHHLPPRHALRTLRARLAAPGAHLAWAAPRRLLVYLHRAAASLRVVRNEASLLESLSASLRRHGSPAWRLAALSDAPPTPLHEATSLMQAAGVVVGVHGAGWANLIFAGPGTYVVEMALAEPHAIYAAHLAYALGQRYFWMPMQGAGLHSAPTVVAPVAQLRRVLREVVIEIETEIEAEIETEIAAEIGVQASPGQPASTKGVDGERPASTPPRALSADATEARYAHVELVVARYEEEWRWCAELAREMRGLRVSLYNKGRPDRREAAAARAAGVSRWEQLPNVGRESHTFLWHIVTRWDQLAPRTVFMQGEPWDHLMPGLTVRDYVRHGGGAPLMPLSAVARSDLKGLAFRDGYAPFAPFTGDLLDESRWRRRNRRRLAALQQPTGLWGGTSGYNTSSVQVPSKPVVAGLPMLRLELHWIRSRQEAQRAPTLRDFWRRYLPGEPPQLLYHAQGAQFALPRAVIRRRPRSFYRVLLDELSHPDPVASYYLELLWYYVFAVPL